MAPVPLRPVAWEESGSPLETTVMTLPGTVYLAAINHSMEDHTADLSVDLESVIGQRPYALWRADVTRGPWVGIECGLGYSALCWWRKVMRDQGIEVEPSDNPPDPYRWKDEKAEVEFAPVTDAQWNGLHLDLPAVKIPNIQSAYFFLSTVPAVVRSVEEREIPWPVSSQPHIHIENHPDGTLLIKNDYAVAVLALAPDWLAEDAAMGSVDHKTGWPTRSVLQGTWRLTPDGRLLYENYAGRARPRDEKWDAAAPPPITTGGPIGVGRLTGLISE